MFVIGQQSSLDTHNCCAVECFFFQFDLCRQNSYMVTCVDRSIIAADIDVHRNETSSNQIEEDGD